MPPPERITPPTAATIAVAAGIAIAFAGLDLTLCLAFATLQMWPTALIIGGGVFAILLLSYYTVDR